MQWNSSTCSSKYDACCCWQPGRKFRKLPGGEKVMHIKHPLCFKMWCECEREQQPKDAICRRSDVACLRRVPRWTRRQTRQTRSFPSSRRCLRFRRSLGSFRWTPPRSSPRTRGRARRCRRPGTRRCPRPRCLRRSAIWSWRWAAAATRAPRPPRPRRWRWPCPATAPTCARSSPRSRSLKVSQQVASCQAVVLVVLVILSPEMRKTSPLPLGLLHQINYTISAL